MGPSTVDQQRSGQRLLTSQIPAVICCTCETFGVGQNLPASRPSSAPSWYVRSGRSRDLRLSGGPDD